MKSVERAASSSTTVPPDVADEALAVEERAYKHQRGQLLERYPGKFVGLYGGEVVAVGEDDEAVAAELFERLGDVTFLIARVDSDAEVLELPSPETVP